MTNSNVRSVRFTRRKALKACPDSNGSFKALLRCSVSVRTKSNGILRGGSNFSVGTEVVSRRAFLATAGVAVGAALAPAFAAPAPGPALHAYPDYGWLRGFSMVPSWGARIEEAWWSYDGRRMREEAALARTVHANCIRLWIEYTAWMADPEKVTANFLDAVAAIAEAGMKTMPCLFNRWHDDRFDYGGTYLENILKGWKPHLDYVRALVTPLARDERVLIWDLCNEPQAKAAKEMTDAHAMKEHEWLAAIARTVRECGLEKLIAGFEATRRKFGKPFLVNECIPGSLNDATRATTARFYDELLGAAGFGWMGWALREGRAISTRRDRYDGNGINGEGFHPFFTKDGNLRAGLEFLKEKPKLLAPWLNP